MVKRGHEWYSPWLGYVSYPCEYYLQLEILSVSCDQLQISKVVLEYKCRSHCRLLYFFFVPALRHRVVKMGVFYSLQPQVCILLLTNPFRAARDQPFFSTSFSSVTTATKQINRSDQSFNLCFSDEGITICFTNSFGCCPYLNPPSRHLLAFSTPTLTIKLVDYHIFKFKNQEPLLLSEVYYKQ